MNRLAAFTICALISFLTACGSDDSAPVNVSPQTNGPSESEEVASSGAMRLTNGSETAFNSVGSTPSFEVTGATFGKQESETAGTESFTVVVLNNGKKVPEGSIQASSTGVSLVPPLSEGRNLIEVYAEDEAGKSLYTSATLWAGSLTAAGTIVDENNQPVNGAIVTANLGDDSNVVAQATTAGGQVTFHNLPNRTINFSATAADGRIGSLATTGNVGTFQIKLIPFNSPSTVDNNDLTQGTSGWNIGTAPVTIIPHTEPVTASATKQSIGLAAVTAATDNDIQLATSG